MYGWKNLTDQILDSSFSVDLYNSWDAIATEIHLPRNLKSDFKFLGRWISVAIESAKWKCLQVIQMP